MRKIIILILFFLSSELLAQTNNVQISQTVNTDQQEIDLNIDIDTLSHNVTYSSFKDNRDGKTYKTIQIGDQIWMAENLNYEISKGCWNSSNADTYGSLYDWKAACKVCPVGWHLPSDAEWKELEMFMGMSKLESDDDGWRGTNVGSKLAGNSGLWSDGALENDAAFGSSGFMVLPGGILYLNDSLLYLGSHATFWSATEVNVSTAWYRILKNDTSAVNRRIDDKSLGFSVRCLKDK